MIVENIKYFKPDEEFNEMIFQNTRQGSTYCDEN